MHTRGAWLTTASALLFVTCTAVAGAEPLEVDNTLRLSPVPLEVLHAQRGRAQPEVLTVMGLDGVVQDNVAAHLVTGKNVITQGSFANSSGLSSVIQNSGNNVLIQNATILMLDVR